MSFKKLAEELELLQKAMPAAPQAGGASDPVVAPNGGELLKSFGFTLADGTEVEAVDGTELVKSLTQRIDGQEADLTKALGSMATMLKSLTATVAQLAGQGRGRRAVVGMPAEGEPAATATPAQGARPDYDGLLVKAISAQQAGRINALDVATLEGYAQRGIAPPEALLKAIG